MCTLDFTAAYCKFKGKLIGTTFIIYIIFQKIIMFVMWLSSNNHISLKSQLL